MTLPNDPRERDNHYNDESETGQRATAPHGEDKTKQERAKAEEGEKTRDRRGGGSRPGGGQKPGGGGGGTGFPGLPSGGTNPKPKSLDESEENDGTGRR